MPLSSHKRAQTSSPYLYGIWTRGNSCPEVLLDHRAGGARDHLPPGGKDKVCLPPVAVRRHNVHQNAPIAPGLLQVDVNVPKAWRTKQTHPGAFPACRGHYTRPFGLLVSDARKSVFTSADFARRRASSHARRFSFRRSAATDLISSARAAYWFDTASSRFAVMGI